MELYCIEFVTAQSFIRLLFLMTETVVGNVHVCTGERIVIAMANAKHHLRHGGTENEDLCCSEEPPKSQKPDVHLLPALLSPAPVWSGIAVHELSLRDISLKDYKEKYLILLFYPYDFTFICPTEMIQFSDRVEEFQKIGCEIVAISTDSQYSHLAWIMTPRKQGGLGDMKIAVLSDKNHKISKTYGVLHEELGISLKALFVIDKDQLIRHIAISDVSLSRSVDETLRVVEGCQFIDKFGGACPTGPRQRLYSAQNEPHYFSSI